VREMISELDLFDPCDVAVIGAGVIGGAITYELAARGASVTLVDARGAGQGSTQAAAGMLVPYLEGFGRPLLPLAAKSLEMYDGFIQRVSRDSGMAVGYRRTGSLQVATADEPLEQLESIAAGAKAAGIDCEMLDANTAKQIEPQLTPEVSAALLVRTHGFVFPLDLTGALSAAAIKHGARVCVPARAERVSSHRDEIEVHVDHDRLRTHHVVIAAGSWSGQIVIDGVPPLPVKPIRGQLVQLAWDGPPLNRILWGSRCYLVPAGPNTILVGATVEDAGFDERTTVAGVRDLLDAACDLVPHLWQAAFVRARVGLRPATADEMPIIGRSAKIPGLVYATGHYRNGVLMAPLTARAVADLVLDNREDPLLAGTSPQRFGEY
jgi:glycine oxidase